MGPSGTAPQVPTSSIAKGRDITARLARSLAAVLLLAGGIVHLNLWDSDGHIPKIGPMPDADLDKAVMFMDFVVSVALAAALLVAAGPAFRSSLWRSLPGCSAR